MRFDSTISLGTILLAIGMVGGWIALYGKIKTDLVELRVKVDLLYSEWLRQRIRERA